MKILEMAGLVAVASLMLTETAWAYLDPGTGSILLQGIIGGIAAGFVFLKMYWVKLVAFLSRVTGQPTAQKAEDADSRQ